MKKNTRALPLKQGKPTHPKRKQPSSATKPVKAAPKSSSFLISPQESKTSQVKTFQKIYLMNHRIVFDVEFSLKIFSPITFQNSQIFRGQSILFINVLYNRANITPFITH